MNTSTAEAPARAEFENLKAETGGAQPRRQSRRHPRRAGDVVAGSRTHAHPASAICCSSNQGSVVELDRAAGEPLDVFVNGTLVAHGEVVVVNEKFGIRLTDVISPAERIRKLK